MIFSFMINWKYRQRSINHEKAPLNFRSLSRAVRRLPNKGSLIFSSIAPEWKRREEGEQAGETAQNLKSKKV